MIKKTDKYADMQDMFIQREIDDKTAQFEAARAKLESEIAQLERETIDYDSGASATETRNEIRYLKEEIKYLEQKYYEDIIKLKTPQK